MTLGAFLYFALLVLWSACVAYFLLFKVFPAVVSSAKAAHDAEYASPSHHPPVAQKRPTPAPRASTRGYSAREGFKSFQTGEELTVDDIVKGLSREP